jgi:polar amino acid transport system permease protein
VYTLRWEYVTNHKDLFINGLALSLKMAVVGLLVGSLIGLVFGFLKSSGNRPLSFLITCYVEFFRNIPLLLIVFFLYYGLPRVFVRGSTEQKWITKDFLPTSERTFMVALAIYSGAYLTEIFSAGIISVGKRYLDAGRSLGLTRFELARHITGPIMFRTVLPSLSNTFIGLFKDTSIAFAIGVTELSYAANKISTDYFRVIEAWTAAGALYLITSYALAIGLRAAERQIKWSV